MAFEISLRPRVSETDMIGHINNVSVVAWLEEGRSYMVRDMFRDAAPAPGRRPPFILRRIEVDYRAQMQFGAEVRVISAVERIGTTSVVIVQEVRQGDSLCVTGRSVLVHFDHDTQRACAIDGPLREGFAKHLVQAEAPPSH